MKGSAFSSMDNYIVTGCCGCQSGSSKSSFTKSWKENPAAVPKCKNMIVGFEST